MSEARSEPTRGGLFPRSPLERALEQIIEGTNRCHPINIPEKVLFEELAWRFENGEIKDLNDCSKEELLDVCKILVRKISTVPDTLCHVRYI